MKKFCTILILVLLMAILSIPVMASNPYGYIEGGGQIIEAFEGMKRPEWFVISFGGWAEKTPAGMDGEWQVNFHNVGRDAIDGSRFHGTDIRQMNFFAPSSNTCDAAWNMTMFGEWNGIPNYKVILRAGDDGSPNDGYADTFRITLYNPQNDVVYDTHWFGEFSNESSCVGTARTGIDAGNLTIIRN